MQAACGYAKYDSHVTNYTDLGEHRQSHAVRVSVRACVGDSAIITHSIARQLKPRPLRQQNQPGLPDFSRVTLKNMGRPGSRLIRLCE